MNKTRQNQAGTPHWMDIEVTSLEGERSTLRRYEGNVLLIVNTASRCGFTSQYAGLEVLHRRYEEQGLVVLGFPCNQFGFQEPGDTEEIRNFCSTHYEVSFPMFAKVDVNGPKTHPLFGALKQESRGIWGTEAIKWNFTKFVVDRSARLITRYAPSTKPEELESDILRFLNAGKADASTRQGLRSQASSNIGEKAAV